MRLFPAFLVLCQLSSASLLFASGDANRSFTINCTDPSRAASIVCTGSNCVATIDCADSENSGLIGLADSNRLADTNRSAADLSAKSGSAAAKTAAASAPANSNNSVASVPVDSSRSGAGNPGEPGRSATIDRLLERAISQNLIEGGVAVIGNHDGILSTTARGRLNASAGSPLIGERTIFDLASLTKVIATTPAVMKLLDEGRIGLLDPLSRWFPEFAESGREEITILNLLTHTSGLEDVSVSTEQPMESAVLKAAAQRYRVRPGSHFHYADINFILLGELVRRVSGETLDAFCRTQIYAPLGTAETMFLPPPSLVVCIAPTSGSSCGIVQDPNARRLGGVAGHAGLFSSAYDLSRFARMILGGGMIDDRRILSERVVTQMTSPYFYNKGAVKRGLGWDMESPFSAPKGSFFSEASFGHTGYSGSSIWIDPQQDLFVILLTNRINYRDTRNFNQLRRDVSTVAAADFKMPGEERGLAPPWEVAKINAGLLRGAAQAISSPARVVKLSSQTHRKWQHQVRVERRSSRTARLMARGGSRHGTRIAKIARAEGNKTAASSKKRRAQGRRA